MPEKQPATFEAKIARLEAIVSEMEGGNVALDDAIALFKEGKKLAQECDELLKAAQAQIDQAMQGVQTTPPTGRGEDEIPF